MNATATALEVAQVPVAADDAPELSMLQVLSYISAHDESTYRMLIHGILLDLFGSVTPREIDRIAALAKTGFRILAPNVGESRA